MHTSVKHHYSVTQDSYLARVCNKFILKYDARGKKSEDVICTLKGSQCFVDVITLIGVFIMLT